MLVPFWMYDAHVLFDRRCVLELWPTSEMSVARQGNAVTRLVLLLGLLGVISGVPMAAHVCAACVLLATLVYRDRAPSAAEGMQTRPEKEKDEKEEKEDDEAVVTERETGRATTLADKLRDDFHPVTRQNPLGNVLLTEIGDRPDRDAAPPAFHPEVQEEIRDHVKKAVQRLNPTIQHMRGQLFGDLYGEYQLDQSLRAFYAMPNTRVDNDQGAFAQYLYGDMPSAKEDTEAGNAQRVRNAERYVLS